MFAGWWQKVSYVPVAWYIERIGPMQVMMFASTGFGSCLLALSYLLQGCFPQVIALSLVAVSNLISMVILHKCLMCRPRAFEALATANMLLLVCVLGLVYTESTGNNPLLENYHRGAVFMLMFLAPLVAGMRFKLCLAFMPFIALVECAALWGISKKYPENAFQVEDYLRIGFVTVSVIRMSFQQHTFYTALYDAEMNLAFEHHASETLTSMFSDAVCQLAGDGDTVISCDQRFVSIMGRDIVGEKLQWSLPEDEQERWKRVIALTPHGAKPAPVTVFPTTLAAANDALLNMDLYIVGHYSTARSGFRIGIRVAQWEGRHQNAHGANGESAPDPEASEVSLDIAPSSTIELPVNSREETRTEVSVPSTTETGQIFDAMREEDSSSLDGIFAALSRMGKREHWLIDQEEVTLMPKRPLGQGSFGLVVRGLSCGTPVAIKVPTGELSKRALQEIGNELRVLRHVRHPNLVLLNGAVVDRMERLVCLVFEMVQGCNLEGFMKRGPTLIECHEVIIGVCRALWHLHSRRPIIIHGDLKNENVLVEGSGVDVRAKVIDFGLSRLVTKRVLPLGGTLRWVAPEVLHKNASKPGPSADIYSFGHAAYFLLTGALPWENMSARQIFRALRAGRRPDLVWLGQSALELHCRPCVEACLQFTADSRPSIQQVYEAMEGWRPTDVPAALGAVIAADEGESACKWEEGMQYINSKLSNMKSRPRAKQRLSSQRRRHAEQQKAMPAVLEEHEAQCTEEVRLALPQQQPTQKWAMNYTCIKAMQQWNFEIPPAACCSFHAARKLLHSICMSFEHDQCNNIHDSDWLQCPRCGLLITNMSGVVECDLCGVFETKVQMAL